MRTIVHVLLGLFAASCGLREPRLSLPRVSEADAALTTCEVAKDPLNPLIVEWPGTDRTSLESGMADGILTVSMVGCYLKVLPSCHMDGSYALRRTTSARDEILLEREADLYAQIPLGAARLSAEIKAGKKLLLRYLAVGEKIAEPSSLALRGDCQDATHYIRALTVGSFSLTTSASGAGGADASLGRGGLGGSARQGTSVIRSSGIPVDQCEQNSDWHECQAPIRLSLRPIDKNEARTSSSTSDTFSVPEAPTVVLPKGAHVSQALVEVEVALDKAVLMQDVGKQRPDEAQAAWCSLSRVRTDENPYADSARRACELWKDYNTKRRVTDAKLAELKKQAKEEFMRLGQLLALQSKPAAVKQALAADFAKRYEMLSGLTELAEAKRISACKPDRSFDLCRHRISPELNLDAELARWPLEQVVQFARARQAGKDAGSASRAPALIRVGSGEFKTTVGGLASVAAFDLGSSPVSTGQYLKCVDAGVCARPQRWCPGDSNALCKKYTWEHPNSHGVAPINGINQFDALVFCEWAGQRLPSRSELTLATVANHGTTECWPDGDGRSCTQWISGGQSKDVYGWVGSYFVQEEHTYCKFGIKPLEVVDYHGKVYCADCPLCDSFLMLANFRCAGK